MNYKTSVSIEPFLDKDPTPLINEIYHFITDTIRIGKMNYIKCNRIEPHEKRYYDKIRENYSTKPSENCKQSLQIKKN